MIRLLLLLLFAVPAAAAAAEVPLILISVDGLRPADLGRGDSPVIDGLAARGASAAMRPSFPSITFPNHHMLVTGLRPDRHGVVSNTMLDPEQPGVRLPDFDNVHVYPLLMGRLGLAPLPVDGDARVLAPALRDSASQAEPLAGGAGGE